MLSTSAIKARPIDARKILNRKFKELYVYFKSQKDHSLHGSLSSITTPKERKKILSDFKQLHLQWVNLEESEKKDLVTILAFNLQISFYRKLVAKANPFNAQFIALNTPEWVREMLDQRCYS